MKDNITDISIDIRAGNIFFDKFGQIILGII